MEGWRGRRRRPHSRRQSSDGTRNEQAARAGKYDVTITNSKGVQIGDRNIQLNKF